MPLAERRLIPIETAAEQVSRRLRSNRVELGILLDAGLAEIGPDLLRSVAAGLGITEREATDAVALARLDGGIPS